MHAGLHLKCKTVIYIREKVRNAHVHEEQVVKVAHLSR